LIGRLATVPYWRIHSRLPSMRGQIPGTTVWRSLLTTSTTRPGSRPIWSCMSSRCSRRLSLLETRAARIFVSVSLGSPACLTRWNKQRIDPSDFLAICELLHWKWRRYPIHPRKDSGRQSFLPRSHSITGHKPKLVSPTLKPHTRYKDSFESGSPRF